MCRVCVGCVCRLRLCRVRVGCVYPQAGRVRPGDEIEIVGIRDTQKTTCTGVEMFRKLLDSGEAGDNIGALLRGVDRDAVERGQVH